MPALTDAAIVALVPAVVELAKRAGLPARWAGLAAVAIAIGLEAARDLGAGGGDAARAIGWVTSGLLAGLAACGLYSQLRTAADPPEPPRGA